MNSPNKNPLAKALTPVLRDLSLDKLLKKLVNPIEPVHGSRTNVAAPDEMILRSIADTTTANIMDTKSIFQMLPDLELAERILISSILSPKDMLTVDLQYKVVHGSMDAEFAAPLLRVISEYWDRTYKINEKLEEMLSDILFHKGSYPVAILPEGSIDAMINAGTTISKESLHGIFSKEGYMHSKNLLGPSKNAKESPDTTLVSSLEDLISVGKLPDPTDLLVKIGLEEFKEIGKSFKLAENDFKGNLLVSDNFELLRVPTLMQRITEQRVTNTLALNKFGLETRKSTGLEGKPDFTAQEIKDFENSLYQRRKSWKHVSSMVVPTPSQTMLPNHGHPLLLHLPPESVVPVFVPADVRKHIGYFILLDINGNPISNSTRTDYYAELSRNLAMRREVTQATVAGTNRQDNVFTDINGRHELDSLARTYGRIVEADLLTRLKNGAYGNNVQINAPEEVYRVMLARTFAFQKTQLLFVPAELITYMAFDYNEFGIGTSLIDKTKILSSMRAMLTFANTMAAVKNAAGRQSVNITLDPEDPNPMDTVEKLLFSYVNGNSARFPLGASSAKDLTDYLQKAGVGMTVTGNSRYPETTMSVEDKSSQRVMVDTELQDNLKKQQIMALGLPPEAVDVGSQVEFATSLIQSNLLLAKNAMNYQRRFVAFLRDMIFKFSINSETIVTELTEIVKKSKTKIPKQIKEFFKENGENDANIIDGAVAYFLDNLEVSLPQADLASLENKLTALEAYIKGVDIMLDAFLASAMYNEETEGMIAANIDTYKECIKAHFIKAWAVDNSFMPEMMAMLEEDKDGESMFDLVGTQGEEMTKINDIIVEFIIFLDKAKKSRDTKLTDANVGVEPPAVPGDPIGGDDLTGGGSLNDFGGGDDTFEQAAGELDDLDLDTTDDKAKEDSEDDKSSEETSEESSKKTTTTEDGTETTETSEVKESSEETK